MSMSKRLLFGNNPLDDGARKRLAESAAEYRQQFRYRLPMKRKATSGSQYWDRLWPISVERAVRELGYDVLRVNDGLFARDAEHIEAIKRRAEEFWRELGGSKAR